MLFRVADVLVYPLIGSAPTLLRGFAMLFRVADVLVYPLIGSAGIAIVVAVANLIQSF